MSLKILIADDDLDDLELLEEALIEAKPNSTIDKATGGKAAINFLNTYTDSNLPDLIILDYNMPDATGSEILAHIRKQKRYDKVPRVIFSTSGAERHVTECIKGGATKYLVKPQTKSELDKLTAEMLSLVNAA